MKDASQKDYCSVFRKVYAVENDSGSINIYNVAYELWTTGSNCDTTADESAFVGIFDQGRRKLEQLGGVSGCFALDHQGTIFAFK